MTKLKLNKTSKKEIIINLRKSLSALCLCGSVISGISSFCISPLIINKIQNDDYDLNEGNLNSIVHSPEIELPNSNTAHFHTPMEMDSLNYANYESDFLNKKADIPQEYLPFLRMYFFALSKEMDTVITNEMLLAQKKYTYYSNDIDMSLDYLKAFSNLEEFNICMNYVEKVNNLPLLTSVKKVTIGPNNPNTQLYFSTEFAQHLCQAFPNMNTIYFEDGVIFEPGSLEIMNNTNVENINMPMDINTDIDFVKLDYLKNMVIRYEDSYDVAVSLNTDEYHYLTNHGTNILFKSVDDKQDYLNACKKIDDILSKINLDESLSFEDKLDQIIMYILDNYIYDNTVAEKNLTGDTSTSASYENYKSQFYQKGFLYGALEMDSQLCGNYAALTEALIDRAFKPDNSYFLTSENHAWNLIKDGSDLYYLDTTWMDFEDDYYSDGYDGELTNKRLIELGYGKINPEEINWYHESISLDGRDDDEKYAHSVNYIPQYMNVNGVFKNQTIDNESIAMSKDFMQKFAHLMSREEALQLLQSSKKQEELFKILSIIFVSLTIITVPKKGLLKDKEDKKKLK